MANPLQQFFQANLLAELPLAKTSAFRIDIVNDNAVKHVYRRQGRLELPPMKVCEVESNGKRWSPGDEPGPQASCVEFGNAKLQAGHNSPRIPQRRRSLDPPNMVLEGGSIPRLPSRRKSIEMEDVEDCDRRTLTAFAA